LGLIGLIGVAEIFSLEHAKAFDRDFFSKVHSNLAANYTWLAFVLLCKLGFNRDTVTISQTRYFPYLYIEQPLPRMNWLTHTDRNVLPK